MNSEFSYPAEKFAAARRSLMLPHTGGEALSIFSAFQEISSSLYDLDDGKLDDQARIWIEEIKELMDTSGIMDSGDRGKWRIIAEQLNEGDKIILANAVDELASWFERKYWGID